MTFRCLGECTYNLPSKLTPFFVLVLRGARVPMHPLATPVCGKIALVTLNVYMHSTWQNGKTTLTVRNVVYSSVKE